MNMNILALLENIRLPQSLNNEYSVIQCFQEDDFWQGKLNRFKDAKVTVIYRTEAFQGNALIACRQILSVAATVSLWRQTTEEENEMRQLILSLPPLHPNLLDMEDEELAKVLDQQQLIVLHPMQDMIDGKIYFGMRHNGEDYLVSSNYEITSLQQATANGMVLRTTSVEGSRLSFSTVLRFQTEPAFPIPSDVYKQVRSYIQSVIFLREIELYDVITIWIMGTYLFRSFRYFPYLHLRAEKGSGKTLLMEILSAIAFNGQVLTNPNASTVLRLIKSTLPTLFIDEAEGLFSKTRSELMAILNTGFSKSGVVIKKDEEYSSFCPKCFASINDINDVLLDRVITVRMVRKTVEERRDLYRENPLMLRRQSEIRDLLYGFALRYCPGIVNAYNAQTGLFDNLPHLTNRAFDIWLPLFKITAAFDESNEKTQIFNSLDKYSQLDLRRKNQRDRDENESAALVGIISGIIQSALYVKIDGNKVFIDPDTVHRILLDAEVIPRNMEKKALSRLLRRTLEIASVPIAVGGQTRRLYVIDKEKISEYQRRYGT
jgi:hypothetical protein